MLTDFEKYIINCITHEGSDMEKVNALYEQFKAEMVYDIKKPISAFEKWIRGMPNSFVIAHSYEEIEIECKLLNYKCESAEWFTRIAHTFFGMKEKLNSFHRKTTRIAMPTHSFILDFQIDSDRDFTAIAICDMVTRCLDSNGFSDIKAISVTSL